MSLIGAVLGDAGNGANNRNGYGAKPIVKLPPKKRKRGEAPSTPVAKPPPAKRSRGTPLGANSDLKDHDIEELALDDTYATCTCKWEGDVFEYMDHVRKAVAQEPAAPVRKMRRK